MGFNNGFEHVRLENKWKKLRIQYREAGMSEEAIQEMYNFDPYLSAKQLPDIGGHLYG